MSSDYAGRYYLNSVCPINPAYDHFLKAATHGKRVTKAKQMHGKRLRRTRRALIVLERVVYNGARTLLNPPSAWPSDTTTQDVDNMANAMTREGQIIEVFRHKKGRGFIRAWNNYFDPQLARMSDLSNIARADLNLGANGAGC